MFFVTEDWYFCSHRLPIASAAIKKGFEVSVITRVRDHGQQIQEAGIKLIPLEISRGSLNLITEVRVIKNIISIYAAEKPDIVHHVAMKPVIYGSIAAKLLKVNHIVNALPGLGFLFSTSSLKTRTIRPMIKLAFRMLLGGSGNQVILQNPDDVRMMCDTHLINPNSITLIRGSGVDIRTYKMQGEIEDLPIVMLASRMLWDKGVGEFVKAAKIINRNGRIARFVLVGDNDKENPRSISRHQLQSWHDDRVLEWWGYKDNMPEILAKASIVCLPSYREGVPKVLIEAAACGKPLIATDAPGCREIVKQGINGFTVPIKDPAMLANAINKLIDSSELRRVMGMEGRKLVEEEFSLDRVVRETLAIYKQMLA